MITVMKGNGWRVVRFEALLGRRYEVYPPELSSAAGSIGKAEIACIEQALAGNPDAVAAVMMCETDVSLHNALRRYNK